VEEYNIIGKLKAKMQTQSNKDSDKRLMKMSEGLAGKDIKITK